MAMGLVRMLHRYRNARRSRGVLHQSRAPASPSGSATRMLGASADASAAAAGAIDDQMVITKFLVDAGRAKQKHQVLDLEGNEICTLRDTPHAGVFKGQNIKLHL